MTARVLVRIGLATPPPHFRHPCQAHGGKVSARGDTIRSATHVREPHGGYKPGAPATGPAVSDRTHARGPTPSTPRRRRACIPDRGWGRGQPVPSLALGACVPGPYPPRRMASGRAGGVGRYRGCARYRRRLRQAATASGCPNTARWPTHSLAQSRPPHHRFAVTGRPVSNPTECAVRAPSRGGHPEEQCMSRGVCSSVGARPGELFVGYPCAGDLSDRRAIA
jgi:hypothetical protein